VVAVAGAGALVLLRFCGFCCGELASSTLKKALPVGRTEVMGAFNVNSNRIKTGITKTSRDAVTEIFRHL
jgi:hypothetical protein